MVHWINTINSTRGNLSTITIPTSLLITNSNSVISIITTTINTILPPLPSTPKPLHQHHHYHHLLSFLFFSVYDLNSRRLEKRQKGKQVWMMLMMRNGGGKKGNGEWRKSGGGGVVGACSCSHFCTAPAHNSVAAFIIITLRI